MPNNEMTSFADEMTSLTIKMYAKIADKVT